MPARARWCGFDAGRVRDTTSPRSPPVTPIPPGPRRSLARSFAVGSRDAPLLHLGRRPSRRAWFTRSGRSRRGGGRCGPRGSGPGAEDRTWGYLLPLHGGLGGGRVLATLSRGGAVVLGGGVRCGHAAPARKRAVHRFLRVAASGAGDHGASAFPRRAPVAAEGRRREHEMADALIHPTITPSGPTVTETAPSAPRGRGCAARAARGSHDRRSGAKRRFDS